MLRAFGALALCFAFATNAHAQPAEPLPASATSGSAARGIQSGMAGTQPGASRPGAPPSPITAHPDGGKADLVSIGSSSLFLGPGPALELLLP